MRQIIDGLIFDTEAAEEIAEHANGRGRSDFRYCVESLHRTERGRWFFAGEGGPLSKYREQVGDGWSDGCGIIPISDAEALTWMEEHGLTELAEQHLPALLEEA
jgi:hypothetical protein